MRFRVTVSFDVKSTADQVEPTEYEEEAIKGYKPTRAQALEYVKEAVETWGGQRHWTDPFFSVKKVVVR